MVNPKTIFRNQPHGILHTSKQHIETLESPARYAIHLYHRALNQVPPRNGTHAGEHPRHSGGEPAHLRVLRLLEEELHGSREKLELHLRRLLLKRLEEVLQLLVRIVDTFGILTDDPDNTRLQRPSCQWGS